MEKLWYGSDEVRDFHPVVEKCLNKALIDAGLADKYLIAHHYGEFTSGIPDFALLDKKTKDFVCIIEVKKTPSDVYYFDSGYQSKSYVDELHPLRWKLNFYPHFCVTNIEITQFYSKREHSSLIGCLLSGSPHDCGLLSEGDKCYERFITLFSQYFKKIDAREEPEFSMYLEAISESFNETYYSVAKILGVNLVRIKRLMQVDEVGKQSVLYELLRFAFYYYIKESYEIAKSPMGKYFKDFNTAASDPDFLTSIERNFSKAMEIDFKDILQNYNSKNAIIPHKLKNEKELRDIFSNFIQTLRDNASKGIQKNSNQMSFVSLLTSEIYNKEEMHATGKIMSDEVLSNILAEFAIISRDDLVIDPCCGDGNLLVAGYNRLKVLLPKSSHNERLRRLYGIEIDANLTQLAAFKLICSDLAEVDRDTVTCLVNADLFETCEVEKFDALIMNPPFLRNEDVNDTTKKKYLSNLEAISGASSFIRAASQPNIYFYFIEKGVSMLKNNGRASIIIMTKFLNNEDGAFLKKYLLPHLKAVIAYPPNFFRGFAVTTCIILLQKNGAIGEVSFLRVKNTDLLSDLKNVNKIIESNADSVNSNYSIVHIPRASLDPVKNWRLYLIDPTNKFSRFERLSMLRPIDDYFSSLLRGKADNCGGSSLIYPYSHNNPLALQTGQIEPHFLGFGMQRNKIEGGRRKIILTLGCLNAQKGLLFPTNYGPSSNFGIPLRLPNSVGLVSYCSRMASLTIKGKKLDLQSVMDSAYSSIVTPQILIPRADRGKHIVYYNPFGSRPILLSTNFFSLSGFKNQNPGLDKEKQLLFITAFLNSVYGQIQFEIHANNQEGCRKLEGFMIQKFKVLALNMLTQKELDDVVSKLNELNAKDVDYLGTEEDNPRKELNQSIANIIHKSDNLGFDSPEALNDYFESFLKEIVLDRTNK